MIDCGAMWSRLFFTILLLSFFSLSTLSHALRLVSRTGWSARDPNLRENLKVNPPTFIVVHHSDTPNCATFESCAKRVRAIQDYHMDSQKWLDIGYNFVIGGDGNIYEGRGWGIHGAHCPIYNAKSLGICFLGNFSRELPEQVQFDAFAELVTYALDNNYLVGNYTVIGHRQGRKTSCPGDKLFEEIQTWDHFGNDIPVQ